jgi:hypothetical protein
MLNLDLDLSSRQSGELMDMIHTSYGEGINFHHGIKGTQTTGVCACVRSRFLEAEPMYLINLYCPSP